MIVSHDKPVDISLFASDQDNDPLTYFLISNPLHGDLTSFNQTSGKVTYMPDTNFTGTDSFTFKASDNQLESENAGNVTINVINRVPITNNQTIQLHPNTLANITLNAYDEDNDPLSFSIVDNPLHGDLTSFNQTSGKVTYMPDTNFTGTDSFTFKASDNQLESENAGNVTIIVANHAPLANNKTVVTKSNEDIYITLEASDSDNDPLTYSLISQPSNGTIFLDKIQGYAVYRSNFSFQGQDTFTYKVNDGQLDSNVATVTIDVSRYSTQFQKGDIIVGSSGQTLQWFSANGTFNRNLFPYPGGP